MSILHCEETRKAAKSGFSMDVTVLLTHAAYSSVKGKVGRNDVKGAHKEHSSYGRDIDDLAESFAFLRQKVCRFP